MTTGFMRRLPIESERSTLVDGSTFRMPSTTFTEAMMELRVHATQHLSLVLLAVVIGTVGSIECVGKGRNIDKVSEHYNNTTATDSTLCFTSMFIC